MIWFSPKGLVFGCYHTGAGDFNLNSRATLTYSVPSEEQQKEYKNEGIKGKEEGRQAYRLLKAKRVNISQSGPNGAGHGSHLPRLGLVFGQLSALCSHCRHRSWTVGTCEVGFSSRSENLLLFIAPQQKVFHKLTVFKNKRLKKLRWPCLPCHAF